MPWSTRQLAQIAGTTVNTVRHYHHVGALPQPERRPNGYKQYSVEHLVRLIQITRLRELGIPLSRIAETGGEDPGADEALRALDAELDRRIAQLQRARRDLASVLSHRAPPATPAGFAPIAAGLSTTRRALLSVYSVVFDARSLDAFREAISQPDPAEEELDALPEDADDEQIEDLASRLAERTRRLSLERPDLSALVERSPLGPALAAEVIAQSALELYSPAQLRALERMHEHLAQQAPAEDS